MENLSHKKRNFNHFCLKERQILENLLKQHYKVSAVAVILGKHRSSIYRQINNIANTDFVRFGKKVKRFYVAKKAHSKMCDTRKRLNNIRIWIKMKVAKY